jgi:hypothetical protein
MPNFGGFASVASVRGAQVKLMKRTTFDEIRSGEEGQMPLSLDDLLSMAMARPPALERGSGMAGPCAEWEFALHAFFDGELDFADSLTFERHLSQCQGCSQEVQKLEVMRRKIRRFAAGWHAPAALRRRSAG